MESGEAEQLREDRRREMTQLRGDIEVLHLRLNIELDRGADRDIIIATAKELREREERLWQLEGFPERG